MDRSQLPACLAAAAAAVLLYVYYNGERGGDELFPAILNETYDYIIVGAGSSGSVLAGRLSEDPTTDVLLLEAGGSDEDNPNIRIAGAAPLLMGSEQDWVYHTEPQKHACFAMKEQRSYWPRGKVLGGSSVLNWMVYARGNRHDYDSWAEEGCEGWAYRDLLPYFLKSEDVQIDEFKQSDYHGKGGPLPISRPNITPMQKMYLNAGKELGYNVIDFNGEDQIGFAWMQSNLKNGERWSTYRAFVKPHLDRRNLHVSPNSFTTKIMIKDKRAIGVECIKNGRKVQILARKEVILSAGTINSPQLLMLSGVGPIEHLQKFGIKVHADLPVGNNLQDHVFIPMAFSINITGPVTLAKLTSPWTRGQYDLMRTGYLSATTLEGLAFLYSNFSQTKDSGKTSDIQMHFYSAHIFPPSMRNLVKFNLKNVIADQLFTASETTESITFDPTLLHPKSRGTIRLRSTDPFDYPEIDPHYLEHPEDVKMAIQSIRFVEKLVGTETMKDIGMDVNELSPMYQVCSNHDFRSDVFWECYVRHYTMTVYHPTSTCRMGGTDDRTAVVDPQLRVKGISGLRVADASVMRNIPAGNTNAPSIMIGEKAASIIRQN